MYHQPKNNKAHSSIYVATFQGAQALSNRPTETYCQPFIVTHLKVIFSQIYIRTKVDKNPPINKTGEKNYLNKNAFQ